MFGRPSLDLPPANAQGEFLPGVGMIKSGELERLYSKWFMSPIPPDNVNLRLPMSGMLGDLLRYPNDNGI